MQVTSYLALVGMILLMAGCAQSGGEEEPENEPAQVATGEGVQLPRKTSEGSSDATPETPGQELANEDSPGSCGPVTEGETVERVRYEAASVPYGTSCQSQVQTAKCQAGLLEWSGEFKEVVCTVRQPGPPILFQDPIVLVSDQMLDIDLSDEQTGESSDEGMYYHDCVFDRQIDGVMTDPTPCHILQGFEADFLYHSNGRIRLDGGAGLQDGAYELFFRGENQWGQTDLFVPLLKKQGLWPDRGLFYDLDARYADAQRLAPRYGLDPSWQSIAKKSFGRPALFQGRLGSGGWPEAVADEQNGKAGDDDELTDPRAFIWAGEKGPEALRMALEQDWLESSGTSLSLWLNLKTQDDAAVVVSNQKTARGFSLIYAPNGEMTLRLSAGEQAQEQCGIGSIAHDQWVHIVVVFSPQVMRVYLNAAIACQIKSEYDEEILGQQDSLWIGALPSGGWPMAGKLASLQVYHEALDSDTIVELFQFDAPRFSNAGLGLKP